MPFIKVRDGTNIYYESSGSGRPMVFVHGWGLARVWKNQISEFSGDYRTITIDLRGHGKSDGPKGSYDLGKLRDDVIHVIRELGLSDVILVGWSMGGSVCIKIMADIRPPEITSLILAAPTPAFTASYKEKNGKMEILKRRGLGVTIAGIVAGYIKESVFRSGNVLKRIVFLPTSGPWSSISVLIGYMKTMGKTDLTGILGGIKIPTLLIHGSRDMMCSVNGGRLIAESIPGARFVVLEDDDHALCLTDPTRVNNVVREFLSSGHEEAV